MDKPIGKLLAIGGAVNKGDNELGNSEGIIPVLFEIGILARMIKELDGDNSRIEIITTASEIPEETGNCYLEAFTKLGHNNTGVIHIKNRDDAANEDFHKRVERAKGILFTGGNQLRLTTILGGTDILKTILRKYHEEPFMVVGTSAGAMAMSNIMINGSSSIALLKNEVNFSHGLGFINDVIFDSHFVRRGRFSRLFQAVATNPECLGIGLGEDTGLLITEGSKMEAVGTGLVIIVDGENIKYTNIISAQDKEPISIENLVVHILVKGNGYDLTTRKFMPAYF